MLMHAATVYDRRLCFLHCINSCSGLLAVEKKLSSPMCNTWNYRRIGVPVAYFGRTAVETPRQLWAARALFTLTASPQT